MSRLPLKQKTVNESDVQEITTAEHNYLAYLAGLELETVSGTYDQSALGSLGKTQQSGDWNIGSFTNTEYTGSNGDVGDHGTLTITTTTTPIYLQDAAVSIHANFRNPLYQKQTSGQQEIQEFNETDQRNLGETLAGIIYTNDYPGTFYLGSSAPSGDYSVAIANVMTDTRTTGADIVYNIYQRHTMSAPTEIDLMAVARGSSSPFNASTGTYKGLIVMADSHRSKTVKGCIDRHLATINSTNRPIGSYEIRSSAQGVPTGTGTWVAKGTATDTRNEIEAENYTNTFQDGAFTKTINSNFSGNYTGYYSRVTRTANVSTYSQSTNTSFPSNFSGNYTGTYTTDYTGTNPVTTTYNNISTNTHWEVQSGSFPTHQRVLINGTQVANVFNDTFSTSIVVGDKTYNRLAQTSGTGAPSGSVYYKFSVTEDVTTTSTVSSTGTYTGFYSGVKTSTFESVGYIQNQFTSNFAGTYTGFYGGIKTTTSTPAASTGTFVGDTIQNTTENIETYTLYVRTA